MKIAYLVENIDVAGGIERSLTTRVNYLVENCNCDVIIFCTQKKNGIPYYKLNNKVKVVFLEPLTSKRSIFGRVLLRYKQSKRIIAANSDIIISVKFFLHNLFFIFFKKNQKLISELREPKQLYEQNTNTILQKINTYFRNFVFRKQDLLITLTEADKKNWGFKNISVIPNPKTIKSDAVSTLDKKIVLSIGRLNEIKGFERLINVWEIVNKKNPEWILKICGEGEEYNNLNNRIKTLNLSKTIMITNKNCDVVQEFLNSSIFVLTSHFEAFGNVLVEAKECGVPAIAFDVPCGPKEIIINNNDGFLIENGNINLMAEKIIFLIENFNIRKKMGINAKNNVSIYDENLIISKYYETIKSVF